MLLIPSPSFLYFIIPQFHAILPSSLLLNVYVPFSHHLLATVYECKGEFRLALQHEKEAYSLYRSQVGRKMLKCHVY